VKVGEGRLALDKLQVHQPAGRIVDKHQQGALRPAILEPPVLAAVDLHQFANAVAPPARLMDPPSPLLAIEPQPVARPTALLRDQTRDTVTAKRLQQPPHLALARSQQLRRSTHRQTTSIDVP
jgi:hypothetical protein